MHIQGISDGRSGAQPRAVKIAGVRRAVVSRHRAFVHSRGVFNRSLNFLPPGSCASAGVSYRVAGSTKFSTCPSVRPCVRTCVPARRHSSNFSFVIILTVTHGVVRSKPIRCNILHYAKCAQKLTVTLIYCTEPNTKTDLL